MTAALKSYSTYQKRVIKEVSQMLPDRPFYFEKAQNNHLKLMIKGVSKPLFTACTPSDSKSFDNFIAEVRRNLKLCQTQEDQANNDGNAQPEAEEGMALTPVTPVKKILRVLAKKFRHQLSGLILKEQQLVEEQGVEAVVNFRKTLIKQELEQILKQQEQDYLPVKEMKALKSDLQEHLDFMMPTLAHYSGADAKPEARPELKIVPTDQPKMEASEPVPTLVDEPAKLPKPGRVVKPLPIEGITELMAMPAGKRIAQLKQLPKAQLAQLQLDLQQAIQEKHQEDIADVVAMMQAKGVSLQEIEQLV